MLAWPLLMMNIKQLEYFVCATRLGSINKAAGELGVAQSAISRQMRMLEVGLNVELLHRSPRGIRPTEQGTLLLESATKILEIERNLRKRLDPLNGACR